MAQEKLIEDEKLEKIEEETKIITQQVRRQLEAKTQELAPVKQQRAVLQAALAGLAVLVASGPGNASNGDSKRKKADKHVKMIARMKKLMQQ